MQGDILNKALKVIKDREAIYGKSENSFPIVAEFWWTYLKSRKNPNAPLEPQEVGLMMVLYKIARELFQGKEDNWIDMAGYVDVGHASIIKVPKFYKFNTGGQKEEITREEYYKLLRTQHLVFIQE